MNTLSLPPEHAALAVAGHQSLVRLSGPAPGLVGQRVALWAGVAKPATAPDGWRWALSKAPLWKLISSDGRESVPVCFGHILGSARITDILPVDEDPDRNDHYVLLDAEASAERLVVYPAGWWDSAAPETHYTTDLSDQLPFLPGLKPGDWVAVLADAARCEDRCPACWGSGGDPLSITDDDPESSFYGSPTSPCPTCGGRGSCDPIPPSRWGMDVMSATTQPRLTVVPVYWRDAKAFIGEHHRHHLPGGNGRFSIGVEDEAGVLRGVAVLGRPKARTLPHRHVLEAMRVATDGCENACSALYGATCRIHKPHGYRKACTYILLSEPGTSLVAAGWKPVAIGEGGTWARPSRERTDKHPTEPKVRWECRCSELPSLGLGELDRLRAGGDGVDLWDWQP